MSVCQQRYEKKEWRVCGSGLQFLLPGFILIFVSVRDDKEGVVPVSEIFEVVMVLCFFLSWPISIRKSLVSRTAKGKSLVFELFLLVGYVFGVASKLVSGNVTYVVIFYVINFCAIFIDVCLYFRNRKLDRLAEQKAGSDII